MSRLNYAIHYPRNFANEYNVYCGTPDELDQLREILLNRRGDGRFHPITRKQAIFYGETRPRQAKQDGEQWYGGWANSLSNDYPASLSDRIKDTHQATLEAIDLAENARQHAEAL